MCLKMQQNSKNLICHEKPGWLSRYSDGLESPYGGKIFLFSSVQTGSGVLSTSYPIGTRGSFIGG
jgi:hypothetical protein